MARTACEGLEAWPHQYFAQKIPWIYLVVAIHSTLVDMAEGRGHDACGDRFFSSTGACERAGNRLQGTRQ